MSTKNSKNYSNESVKEYYHSTGLYDSIIYKKNITNQNLSKEEIIESLLLKNKKLSNKVTGTNKKIILSNKNYKSKIMVLGDMPSQKDINNNKLFSDDSGELLTKMLSAISIDCSQVYLANIIPFYLTKEEGKNIKKYNSLLRKIVHEHISTINPETILLLGSFALQTLFGEEYSIAKNRGQWLSYSTANNSINTIPSFHPTFLLKQPSQKKKSWEDLQELQKKLNNA
jgi:uracil-DNA glycosylase family 4